MAKFVPVSHTTSLTDRVIGQIRDAIVRGDYKPGDKLPSEPKLVELFQVSRTSVREAIKVLAGQGFIEVKRGLGAFVLKANPQTPEHLQRIIEEEKTSLLELFQIRKVLECEAAALAAEKATPLQLADMRQLIAEADRISKQLQPDKSRLNEINSLFHCVLLKAAGNRTLERVMQSLISSLSEAREITIQLPGRYSGSVEGHRRILAAVVQGNAAEAREEMKFHLQEIEVTIQRMSTRTH